MKTGETVSNWVSVDDALPEILEKVMVVVEHKFCNRLIRFISDDERSPREETLGFEWGFERVDEDTKVTHWAYLPELPEGK